MTDLKTLEVWFVTGSQHLYGLETLEKVATNAQTVAASLGRETSIPAKVVFKAVATTPEEIRGLCREANNAERVSA